MMIDLTDQVDFDEISETTERLIERERERERERGGGGGGGRGGEVLRCVC